MGHVGRGGASHRAGDGCCWQQQQDSYTSIAPVAPSWGMDWKDGEASHCGRPLRVVLVEDHAGFRDQLRHKLETLDGVHVVHMEDNADAALRWLGEHPGRWDLLVLDIFLAEGHGYSVLRACQGRPRHQRAVFLTSYTREPARSQALALGADAVFDKGIELDGFMEFACQCRQEITATQPA